MIMEKRVLSNGVEIPAIGLGVYLSPEGQATADSVRWAVEAGYRHIDAAAVYGNECSVGEGIKTCGIPICCFLHLSCGMTISERVERWMRLKNRLNGLERTIWTFT
mgnify:CR=1 FL=1